MKTIVVQLSAMHKNGSFPKPKILLLFSFFAFSGWMFSQPTWSVGLNNISSSSQVPNFGTSNNFPIDFYTNNIKKMTLSTSGILRVNGLSGVGNRLLQVNVDGDIGVWSGSGVNPNAVFYGDGTWRLASSMFSGSGSSLGVGLATPLYALDVAGETRTSSNMRVGGNLIFGAAGQFQIAFNPSGATNGIMRLGAGGNAEPIANPCAEGANFPSTFQYGGLLQLFYQNNNAYTSGTPVLQLASTSNQTKIFSRYSSLNINTECNENVNICSGGSGNVGVGALANANTRLGIDAGGTALTVNTTHASDYLYNTKFTVNRNNAKAITMISTEINPAGDENFIVYGDGRTRIGGNYLSTNYKLSVNGKIIAEEVVIMLRQNWPDYVFSKEYKLMPLKKLEEFISENSHLPNIPASSEIKESGISTGEILTKQMEKIEELTLYLIEIQKEIDALKAENKSLKEKR